MSYFTQSGLRFSRKALEAFLALGGGAALGDRLDRQLAHALDRARRDAADQALRGRDRSGSRLEQLPHALVDGRVELVERHHAVDEAERLRPAPP